MKEWLTLKAKWIGVVLSIAVVAGIAAVSAYGAIDIYCNDCQVGSVPAVSPTRYHYDNYMGETYSGDRDDLHIYFYNVTTGNQTCEEVAYDSISVYRSCANYATARCHILDSFYFGPTWARCDSYY